MANVTTVLIDSLRSSDKDSVKLVKKFTEFYPGVRVICFWTNDGGLEGGAVEGGEFSSMYLWSLPRSGIREVVSKYLDEKPLGDEDVITSRLATDFEVMNIHRTPMNCITLLKVSEAQYEDSPVNRAEMIKRVLYLLFNIDSIPNYKQRPDLKDCEYVLGYFCEGIIRSGESEFTREKFLASLLECCKERLIELDVGVVFDVLYANNIIVRIGSKFEFKFAYWVFYFGAQRMAVSKEFADYMYENMRYSDYPEIMEFYTGVDRGRGDAVSILSRDLRNLRAGFRAKLSLPDNLDVFGRAQWVASEEALDKMQDIVSDGVQSSSLPASVKDAYADRVYDRARPYTQDVRRILGGESYGRMLQAMRAAAKALRNSDYVEPELKRELLAEILGVWEEACIVIVILVPALVKDGEASFDDVRFVLDGFFGEGLRERFHNVLAEVPQNVTSYYHDDLFSHKMFPLLADGLTSAKSGLIRHFVILMLVKGRPRGWAAQVDSYIASLAKNSFYLFDLYESLRSQYKYGYASQTVLSEMRRLIMMCAAKHVTGAKRPGTKMLSSLEGKLQDGTGEGPIPDRASGDLLDAEADPIESKEAGAVSSET